MRYALFAGAHYYPSGGFEDFVDSSDDLQSLIDKAKKPIYRIWDEHKLFPTFHDWWHIVDLKSLEIIERS